MEVVYMVRHQAHGVFTSVAFAQQPSEAQLAQLREYLSNRHGPGWVRVVEIEVLDHAADIPLGIDSAPKGGRHVRVDSAKFGVSAIGTVTGP